MKAFEMTDDGDIRFDGRDLVLVEGIHEIAQEMEMSFGTRKGEWFLDELEGANFDALYNKPFDENEFRTDLIESLSGATQQINVLNMNFGTVTPTRSISLVVEAQTEDGELIQLNQLEVGNQ